ncbi:MAG TPA: glycosyltransferase family 4 protein [Stellaceae bacterium]|nr:glycosyltransferase family 4 protein [Stellaceae bacterium]
MLGLFPPPIDGQRVVTERMFHEISQTTTALRRGLDRFPRLGPLSKPVSAVAAALLMAPARFAGFSAVYLAPHSGIGLLYSSFLAAASRLCGYTLYVHYHSYRNMRQRSALMALFIALCGPRAVHIVLAPPMQWGLRNFYKHARRIEVLSNSVFIPPVMCARNFLRRRIRVGHLSNLSREKGIELVLECLRQLRARKVEVEFVIAGPTKDEETRNLLARAAVEFGDRLRYLGPLPQSDVQGYYESIDVFLFPTMYEHEAEPLVVIDAVSLGVPVVATDRGCIGYLLQATGGRAFDAEEFVERAVEQIADWAANRGELARTSERAQHRFRALHQAAQANLSGILRFD